MLETDCCAIKAPRLSWLLSGYCTKTCTEKNGFKHWDIVKAEHKRLGIVIGSIRSLKAKCITLRTNFDDNFSVSYNKTKLLWRPSSIVYC